MSIYFYIVIGSIIGYIFGSIPFALIIGKIFYKIDVREHGSGNLGATNVARTLGPLAGILVLLFDILKAGGVALAMYKISEHFLLNSEFAFQSQYLSIVYCVTGLLSCIGHCHPCFNNFKGGKAVATIYGYLLFMNIRLFIIAFIIFVVVMLITRIVSLGSILSAISVIIFSLIPHFRVCYIFNNNELESELSLFIYFTTLILLVMLLIYRHLSNIERIIKGEEKKFKFEHKNRKNHQ